MTASNLDYIVLDDPTRMLQVVAASLRLYIVQLRDGVPIGPKFHVFTGRPGDIVYGGVHASEGEMFAFVAERIGPTEICWIEDFRSRTVAENDGSHLCDSLTRWHFALFTFLMGGISPRSAERPKSNGTFELRQGQLLNVTLNKTQWLSLGGGRITLYGDASCLWSAGDAFLPVAHSLWFRAESDTTGQFREMPMADEWDRAAAGMSWLAARCLQRGQTLRREHRDMETARIRRLPHFESITRSRAIEKLSVYRHVNEHAIETDDKLADALEVVGRSLGSLIRIPKDMPASGTPGDRLEAICFASKLRIRRVRLTQFMTHSQSGYLIALHRENEAPAVLIPVTRLRGLAAGYDVYFPGQRSRRRLKDDDLSQFMDDAYQIVPPLRISDVRNAFGQLTRFAILPFLRNMNATIVLMMIGGLLGMILPVAYRIIVDRAIPDADVLLILDLAIGVAAVAVGQFILSQSQNMLMLSIKTAMTARVQMAVVDRLLRLPIRFFRKYSTGDLLNRTMTFTEINSGLSMVVLVGLFSGVSALLMLSLCFYYSGRLAWIALFAALITSAIRLLFTFAIRKKTLGIIGLRAMLFGHMVQLLSGITKIQTSGAENRAFYSWASQYGTILRQQDSITALENASGIVNTAVQTVSSGCLYYFAVAVLERDTYNASVAPGIVPVLTIGVFFAFQSAFTSTVSGTVAFFDSLMEVFRHVGLRSRVAPILVEPLETDVGKTDPGKLEGRIVVRNVTFRYPEAGKITLSGVSLDAYPGEFIAVVGPSGSGKTTLLRLILGFERPNAGQILCDGYELGSLDLDAVRRQTGAVLQGARIAAGTIFEFISGLNRLKLEEVWSITEEAGLANDIRAMPMGLHTILPEGATTLSGGQRQRLLIARALAGTPSILLFDEATSALDNRTQEVVYHSLRRRKVTRIVVAHRISTIRDADRIYVLHEGTVRQCGTFEQLMKTEGIFRQLASRQDS